MPNRPCDGCGKTVEAYGGKVCGNSHFICKSCVWAGTMGGLTGNGLKACPLCRTMLK
jgi:hypothetical protein